MLMFIMLVVPAILTRNKRHFGIAAYIGGYKILMLPKSNQI